MEEIIDEVNDFENAVQIETWVEMPKKTYGNEREFNFEMLARALNLRVVELRVALSNVFCVMMARNSLWRDRP